jgi:O-antigen ligase
VTAARRRSRSSGAGRAVSSSGKTGNEAKRRARAAADGVEPAPDAAADSGAPWANRIARWLVFALAVAPPFFVSPTADDAFRLPKTLAAETLVLLSLVAIAIGWWSRRGVVLGSLARRQATVVAVLLAVAVLPGAVIALHPLHWQRATVSFAIALAGLALWSERLGAAALRRAVSLLLAPAMAMALLAILQEHGIFRPFAFSQRLGGRFQLTSLAGSVGDLAAFLVLPAIVLQSSLARARAWPSRAAAAIALAAIAYTIVVSQTLAALVALVVASLVFWASMVPWRRLWIAAVPLAALGIAALLWPPLADRIDAKVDDLVAGRWDSLLSGRPDGWKASLGMFRDHPVFGVGNGGYGSTFAPTKLALIERGVAFWSRGRSAHFANAHNDYLEALAEWGAWGTLALLAVLAIVVRRLRGFARDDPPERALAIAGVSACAVLALASFPLRIALTGYPWLLLLAWILAGSRSNGDDAEAAAGRLTVPARAWAILLAVVFAALLVVRVGALLDRLEASRIVRTTSQVAQLALQSGQVAARPVLQANLPPLHRAAELDPLAVGVALTTGSHYLLLGNTPAAIESYQRGLAIEPRSELYLNLARAQVLAGRRDEAAASAERAVTLDPLVRDVAVDLGVGIEPRPDDGEDDEAEQSKPRRDRPRRRARRP